MHLALGIFIVALVVLVIAVPAPQAAGKDTGIAIPLHRRTGLVNADNAVDIHAFSSHLASVKAKILRSLGNYENNTRVKHPTSVEGAEKRQNVVRLTYDRGEIWYTTILIGTPVSDYTVALDTTFSDFIMPGIDCSNCDGHFALLPWASETANHVGGPYEIRFMDEDTATVDAYNDTVSIGGLSARDQTIGVAESYPLALRVPHMAADGVMGMGFQSASNLGGRPVFQNLVAQGKIDDPVFSFKLSRLGAELYLGGVNSNLYTGSFTYVYVTKEGFWQVNIDSIEVNEETIFSNIPAIIDIGSSLITGPAEAVRILYQTEGLDAMEISPGIYAFACSSIPTVILTFGGTRFSIPPSSLIVGPIVEGSPCVSSISDWDIHESLWVVGTRFLMNVYTTFDVGQSRVGFAQLA